MTTIPRGLWIAAAVLAVAAGGIGGLLLTAEPEKVVPAAQAPCPEGPPQLREECRMLAKPASSAKSAARARPEALSVCEELTGDQASDCRQQEGRARRVNRESAVGLLIMVMLHRLGAQ
jgi:hypothetical protein